MAYHLYQPDGTYVASTNRVDIAHRWAREGGIYQWVDDRNAA